MALVADTGWNDFLELNRMAFDDYLPRNSESYCIGKTLRMIHKQAPNIKWVISFADGCSCGDGTIYRASNFVLTGIHKNTTIRIDKDGNKIANKTMNNHCGNTKKTMYENSQVLGGFMLRYVYFIDKRYKEKLRVPIIPFSKIDELGAGMYKGENITQAERHEKLSESQIKNETK